MIQSMVREFSHKEIALEAMERDRTKTFPIENIRKMREIGLMGMMVRDNTAEKERTPSVTPWPFPKSPMPAPPPPLSCPFTIPSSVKAF